MGKIKTLPVEPAASNPAVSFYHCQSLDQSSHDEFPSRWPASLGFYTICRPSGPLDCSDTEATEQDLDAV